jgi:hypothetical protein
VIVAQRQHAVRLLSAVAWGGGEVIATRLDVALADDNERGDGRYIGPESPSLA